MQCNMCGRIQDDSGVELHTNQCRQFREMQEAVAEMKLAVSRLQDEVTKLNVRMVKNGSL